MKKIINITLALCLIAMMPTIADAQLKMPQTSPKASVSQTVGLTEISIDYHAPSVKGRVIWGEVVPFDSVWRTGANEATVISFSDDVTIEGKKLAAGKYALFTIPSKSGDWTIIFNKKHDLWGAYGYDKKEDVLRVNVKQSPHDMTETMMFAFGDVTINSVNVVMRWEKIKFSFKVQVETDKKVMAIIKDSIAANPNKASIYRQAAGYTMTSGLHLSDGLTWVNKAISIKEEDRSYWTKAQILAKLGKYNDAITAANKAIDLAKDDKDFAEAIPNIKKNIDEYKAKMK